MSKEVKNIPKANSVDENFEDYLSCEDDEFMTKTMKVKFFNFFFCFWLSGFSIICHYILTYKFPINKIDIIYIIYYCLTLPIYTFD